MCGGTQPVWTWGEIEELLDDNGLVCANHSWRVVDIHCYWLDVICVRSFDSRRGERGRSHANFAAMKCWEIGIN